MEDPIMQSRKFECHYDDEAQLRGKSIPKIHWTEAPEPSLVLWFMVLWRGVRVPDQGRGGGKEAASGEVRRYSALKGPPPIRATGRCSTSQVIPRG